MRGANDAHSPGLDKPRGHAGKEAPLLHEMEERQ